VEFLEQQVAAVWEQLQQLQRADRKR